MRYFTLGHVYRQVDSVSYVQAEHGKQTVQALMDKIKKPHCKVEGKLSSSISDLQQEVTSVKQEVTLFKI